MVFSVAPEGLVAPSRTSFLQACFAASLLGEALTWKGILATLNLETGIPIYEVEPLLLFFILFTLLGAIGALGYRGKFVDQTTGLEKVVVAPGKGFKAALSLKEGGSYIYGK